MLELWVPTRHRMSVDHSENVQRKTNGDIPLGIENENLGFFHDLHVKSTTSLFTTLVKENKSIQMV